MESKEQDRQTAITITFFGEPPTPELRQRLKETCYNHSSGFQWLATDSEFYVAEEESK